tara:strand:+ start:2241 stop:2825 length:585 start_codon:yes stop_codon:yes gene_type:complete
MDKLKIENTDYYFIHIPKNAGTSFIKQFCPNSDGLGSHFPIRLYDKVKTLAIVRHPKDRLESIYNYSKMEKSYWHSQDGSTVYGKNELYDYCSTHSYSEFVKAVCEENKFPNNIHLIPQWFWLYDEPNTRPSTKIIKLETLNEGLSEFFEKDIELMKINTSKKLNHLYTKKMIDSIQKYYDNDFKMFDYTMGWV